MVCAACDHENRAHAKFCEECGAALRGADSAAVRPDLRAYTPRHLADRILTSRAALQGERKAVTVLFADVQGSMALAEQVDAEAWHTIMNRFFVILAEGVHRFEGTVNQYTGDGIMALFGAPLAHEDHAQRACYAALHLTATLREYAQTLRRERGLQFSVRMGLNSGEVVVGAIGDDLRMDYTAQGHTVGLASRMEQLCEPGRVYLTEATAALVAGYFELEDLGAFTIKGVRAPVRVYTLVGAGPLRTRLDLARARGLSRFVGRADELAQLDAAFAHAAAQQRAAAVAIVAAAGVGKSRLCAEFVERCRNRGAAVVETQALAHGASLPYLPVLTLFRRLLGVDERDAPQTARQKIAGGLLLLDDRFKSTLPLQFDFLGVPDPTLGGAPSDPDVRLDLLLDAAVALLRARAARQPALLLIEDLHWLDASSDTFTRRLIAALAEVPIVVVLNFRPEYHGDWLGDAGCERISLQPLNEAAVDELLVELLGSDPAVAEVGERLRARAAGNPFFLEELVLALVQNGTLAGTKGVYHLVHAVDEAAIPTSVQAVLAARIDRLDGRDKDVLQTAAVIGKQFAELVLRVVTQLPERELGAALGALADAELLFEQSAYPTVEYAFKHPLTQEVAYTTQLASRRAALHAAVAEALDPRTDEPSAERAMLLAYHWEKAGNALQAAQWQRRAARALMGSDTREAITRLRRVLELLGDAPDDPEAVKLVLHAHDDLLRVGRMGNVFRAEGERLYASARALAERTGNRALLARVVATFGEFLVFSGARADGQVYMQEANALARGVEDQSVQLSVIMDNAQTAFWGGRLRETLAFVEQALQQLEPGMRAGNDVPVGLWGEAFVRSQRGIALALMGRLPEGLSDLELSVRLADEGGTLEARCVARQFYCLVGSSCGEITRALPHAHAALEFAVRAGNAFMERLARATLGGLYAVSGRAHEAISMLEQAIGDGVQGVSVGAAEWLLLSGLSEAHRLAGDPRTALSVAARAIEASRSNDALAAECLAQLALAAALVQANGGADIAALETALARAESLIDQSGAESFRPRLPAIRAALALAQGDRAAARRHWALVERLCRERGMNELADQAARELVGVGEGR